MVILDGKSLKEELLNDLKEKTYNLNISFAVIQIGNNEASNVYIKQKKKMCDFLNINFNHYKFDENIDENEIIALINRLNNDSTTGILVQLPIPDKFNTEKILNTIDYKKDVDGLTKKNMANLILNEKGIIPCTPKGILTLLNKYNIKIEGANVVIIGRSNLVGKPLFNLLLNNNASVSICHTKTKNIRDYTLNADIIIAAAGCPFLLTDDMVKEGCIVIDVGITRIGDHLYGDVDFDNVKKKASFISPVPGGVGPMTIASLASNILDAYYLQHNDN